MIWIPFILLIAASLSVTYDIMTYEKRQDRWEQEHPGQVYVRNYRQLTCQDS